MSTRLSQTMASLHEMQIVALEGAAIGNDGVETLANALNENTSVTEIDLKQNNISVEGASRLADALKESTTVTKINLAWNKIGADGASAPTVALLIAGRARTPSGELDPHFLAAPVCVCDLYYFPTY